jgi:hypothetical protein
LDEGDAIGNGYIYNGVKAVPLDEGHATDKAHATGKAHAIG